MKNLLKYVTLLVVGLCVGVGSALTMSGVVGGRSLASFANVNVDGWHSDWSIGTATASPYVRARIARHGLLALAKEEAVYFTRSVDDDGELFTESCRYQISGTGQDAFWWSITLYDSQSRLPMNDDGALSIDATKTGDVDHWSAIISSERPTRNSHWISSHAAGQFDLTMRLYRPSQAILSSPQSSINPPQLQRLDCLQGGAS